MKKKLPIILFILLIIGIAAGAAFYFLRSSALPSASKKLESIPENKTRAAAQESLNVFESWKGAYIDQTYRMYDIEGNITAYLYTINDSYGKAGYIIISANNRHAPVIEISKALESPQALLSTLAINLTEGTERRYTDVRSQIIYLGGNSYYGKLSFREGADVADKYYSLNPENISEVPIDELKTKYDYYLKTKDQGADEAWEKIK